MMNASRFAFRAGVLSVALSSGSTAFPQATSTTAPPAQSALALQAQAEADNHVSNYIDLSAGVGYSSNPYLESGGGNGSAYGRVSAYAAHSVVSNRTTTDLSAYVENQSYTSNNGSSQSFSLNGSTRYVVNPRFDVYGNVGFSGDYGGQLYNRFTSVPSSAPPVDTTNPLPPVDVLDPNLVGLNRRQYRLLGQGGFSYKMSERDFVNASVGYQRVFFGSNGQGLDYGTVTGSLGWDRVLTERRTVGLRAIAQHTDYRGGGSSTIISPEVTGTARLSEGWSLSGAVGLSFVDNNTIANSDHSTNFTADASLCKALQAEKFCAAASRSSQASIGQSVVTATSASLTYFRNVGTKDTIQLGANVTRTTGGNTLLIAPRSTYYGVNGSYNRKVSLRLSAGVEGGVRRIEQSGRSVPTDASASIFLRYRLGDLQ